MNIIPKPHSMEIREGEFVIGPNTAITMNPLNELMAISSELKAQVDETLGFKLTLNIKASDCIKFEIKQTKYVYELEIKSKCIKVISGNEQGLFYGLQTLKQLIEINGRHLPCMQIRDKAKFTNRGFYYDVTRGKVPTLKTLKSLVDNMAYYKLNQLQLYVEHTFLYSGQSEVWSVTDPLTADDIIELDAYCIKKHVELVPSIATFGHLYEAMQSISFEALSEFGRIDGFSFHDRMRHHTLNVTLDESFELVKGMIDDFLPLVKSKKFNICADETFDLGTGKTEALAKEVGKSKLYVDFLKKIFNYVKLKDKEVMFWGDVILNYPECVEELPKDLICLNWWYDKDYPEDKVKAISDNGFRQYMCPGVNGWNTLMNKQRLAYDNIRMMTKYGEEYEALGILNTDWGDYGHWNFIHTSFPGMIYGAAFSWGDLGSFDEMNRAIDATFYKTDRQIMNALVEISGAHHMTFLHLVRWIEKGELIEMDKITMAEADIYKSNIVIENHIEELLDAMRDLNEEVRKHIQAFVVSARGIQLLNSCYLVIKEKEYGLVLNKGINYWELAEQLEYWMLSFKIIWLEDNKPSELYRSVDFMKKLTTWLRTS